MASQKSIYIQKAQELAAKGKIDKAILEWKKVIDETPQDGNVYNTIADLYLRVNDRTNAIETCLKAASVYREAGFELKGVAVLKKILKIDPNRIDIYEKLADINADRGLTGTAVEAYNQTAKLYMQRGSFKAAIAVYQKVARFVPDDPEIPLNIARLYHKQEQYRDAILAYEQAEAIYESKGMVSDARHVVEEIIRIDPHYLKNLAKKEATMAALEERSVSPSPQPPTPSFESTQESLDIAPPVFQEESNASHPYVEEAVIYPEMVSRSVSEEEELQREEPGIYPEVAPLALLPEEEFPPMSLPPREELAPRISPLDLDRINTPPLPQMARALEPLYQEPPILSSSQQSMKQDRVELVGQKEPPGVSEVIFQAHLAEVDIYLRYGLNQNAIEKLLLAKELVPTREEPYLKLKELYLKEGQKDKADQIAWALASVYEQKGAFDKKEALLRELQNMGSGSNNQNQMAEGDAITTPLSKKSEMPPSRETGVVLPDIQPISPPLEPTQFSSETISPNPQKPISSPWEDLFSNKGEVESTDQEEYFDLASAMTEELKEVSNGVSTVVRKEPIQNISEKPAIGEKRQQYVESCFHLGIAHKEMGNLEKAVRELEHALEGIEKDRFHEVVTLLASCYMDQGNSTGALDLLKRGMTDVRSSGEGRLNIQYDLALLYEQQREKENAFPLYQEIYRVNPRFKDVSNKMREFSTSYRILDMETKRVQEPVVFSSEGVGVRERMAVGSSAVGTNLKEVSSPVLVRKKGRVSYV